MTKTNTSALELVNIYLPESVVFENKEYQGGAYHMVPLELAELVASHPIWSKAKPSVQVSPLANLKRQSLSYLLDELARYEDDIASRDKQIQIHVMMASTPPSSLLVAQRNAMSNYAEFKHYALPLIKVKELEERERRARIEAKAQARGSVISWNPDNTYSEHLKYETYSLGGNK